MYHIKIASHVGWYCPMCGNAEPYAFGVPDVCECGKPWREERILIQDEKYGGPIPYLQKTCSEGHKHQYCAANTSKACPQGELIEEFLQTCAITQRGVHSESDWKMLKAHIARLLPLAIKVDELFPDGLQNSVAKLGQIKHG